MAIPNGNDPTMRVLNVLAILASLFALGWSALGVSDKADVAVLKAQYVEILRRLDGIEKRLP